MSEFNTTIQLSHLLAVDIGLSGDESTIIDAICHSNKQVTVENLLDTIASLFSIDYEPDRLTQAVERLISAHKLFQSGNILIIAPEVMEEINRVTLSNEHVEKEALADWLESYQAAIGYQLNADEVSSARLCFLSFIRTFFLTHGAECYSFALGQKQNEDFDIHTLAEQQVEKHYLFQHAPALVDYLSAMFTFDLTPAQRTFLLTQLKKAVCYLSMVIDSGAQAAIMKHLEGVTIYFDTSILYRLLNLQGEKRFKPIQQLVNYCKSTGISLKVLSISVEEMQRRIAYDSKVIIDHPIPVSFASIGYKCRSSENYISTFWRAASETGISPRDFNAKFSDIPGLLEGMGIVIDDHDYQEKYALSQIVSDLESKITRYESADPDYKKSPKALYHDAQCLAIMSKLQLSGAKNAIEAKTFFLSSDRTLVRVQRRDYEYKNKTDMVVVPSQLMQFFCMTTPTQNYLESFLGLFSSSRTYFGANSLPNEKLQEIMGRVAAFRGTTPAYAERILTSQLIQASFSQQETECAKVALIDDAMIIEVEQMEEELGVKDKALELAHSDNNEKGATIEGLELRIGALEEAKLLAEADITKSKEVAAKEVEKAERLEKYLRDKAYKAGARQARAVFYGGIILTTVGAFLLTCTIAAFIPNTYHLVAPCISWIMTSPAAKSTSIGDVAAIAAALALACISGGITLVKPGYSEIKEHHQNAEWNKEKKKLYPDT